MQGNKSREAMLEFLEYVAQKGLMAQATARARKAAVGKVLGILSEEEAADVTLIDLDSVMTRFGHLQGKGYTPDSLTTYKSRVRSALDDFGSYVANPLAFKPGLQTRERKSGTSPTSSKPKNGPERKTELRDMQPPTNLAGPMASSILPVPIRPNLTVHIQGLPYDLTVAEAKKIAAVVQAMATST